MSDLIDRQAAIHAVMDTDWYQQNRNKDMVHGANSSEHQAWYKAEDVYKALENVPSAQPERKKGKWLRHPAYKQKDFCEWDVCSVCGTGCHRRKYGKNPDGTMYEDIYGYRFCPNCGAEMEV